MVFLIIGGALFYLACSVLAYRGTYAHLQNEYKDINCSAHVKQDAVVALLMSLSGPIGLFGAALIGHGFKYGFSVRD